MNAIHIFRLRKAFFYQIMVFCLFLHLATVKCHHVSNTPTAYIFTATRLFQVDIEVIARTEATDPYITSDTNGTLGLSSYISKC
jgi:hypothetical protein